LSCANPRLKSAILTSILKSATRFKDTTRTFRFEVNRRLSEAYESTQSWADLVPKQPNKALLGCAN
jgi:hypothetical protein